jgi:hypothetical protein
VPSVTVAPVQQFVWRTKPSSRLLATLGVMSSFGGIAVDAVFISRSEPLWSGLLFVALGLLAVWLFAFRPRLVVDGTDVVIRNPLRTHRFGLCDVVAISPAYSGVEFCRRSGRPLRAWAVQKTNLSWMLRRPTRADAVAEVLNRAAESRCREGG